VRTFGRLAGKIMSYYVVTDLIALSLGAGAMLVLRPGVGMRLTEEVEGTVGAVPSVADVLLGMVPTNVFQAFADGNVVQLVLVAVLLGIATLMLADAPRARLAIAYSDLAALFRRFVDLVLLVAPIGIGALMAVTVGRYGAGLLGPLSRFLLGVYSAQFVVFLGYMTLLALFTDRRPLGFQLNKDGTSVMLGAVLFFTAQAAGVQFSPAAFLTILLIGLLLSEGSGGIPGGGFVIALIYVQAFNLPIEVAAIVGGIYRLVDMGNTTVNVMGDMVGTSLVAHSESRRSARAPSEGAAR
jgi:Na+/H+-dicarboxylate symporter